MSRSIGLVERPVKEFLLPTTRSAPFFLFFFFFSLYFYILVFLSLIPTGAFQYILKSSFFSSLSSTSSYTSLHYTPRARRSWSNSQTTTSSQTARSVISLRIKPLLFLFQVIHF